MKANLTEALLKKFESDNTAYQFLSKLLQDAKVYLFGGAIRDYLDGNLDASRDIDLVVEARNNLSIDILDYLPSSVNISYKKNRYDGYKIDFNNHILVDIWNLNDTWAFRTNKVETSAENLVKSVYLNIDALVYCLNNNMFLNNSDLNYLNVINNRTLDIVLKDNPYEDLNLLRALVFQKRYSLEFSDKLKHRFFCYMSMNENYAIEKFINLQNEHFANVILDQKALVNILYKFEIERGEQEFIKDNYHEECL